MYFIFYIYFLLTAYCLCKETKPNIIIILGDDIGWNDFGFHGSNQIPTPNIDALGYNGVILNRFYTQQACTPSRSALLTGNYPIHSGLQGFPLRAGENASLPSDQKTLPQALKDLGYKTNLVGKWHLGFPHHSSTPLGKGFDYHFGYWNGFVGYFNYYFEQPVDAQTTFTGFDLHENFVPQFELNGRYATELFTEKSLQIIDNHRPEEPLFLMLSHLATHTGDNGTELGVPDFNVTQSKYSYIADDNRKRYADVLNIMDESVGKVVSKLSEKGMLENSIVIFMSDNGAPTSGLYGNSGSNWPLRGMKFTLYEGAIRGSGMIYSPLLEKKSYINNELIHITDLYPTLISAAGGDLAKLRNIDGIDQWETIKSNHTTRRTELLINIDDVLNYSGFLGYNGRYKLLNGSYSEGLLDSYYGDDGRGAENPEYDVGSILQSATNEAIRKLSDKPVLEEKTILKIREDLNLEQFNSTIKDRSKLDCSKLCLFDIFVDPCETVNIIQKEQAIAEELKDKLLAFYKDIRPQSSHTVDLNSNPEYFNNAWHPWLDKKPSFSVYEFILEVFDFLRKFF